MPQRLPPRPPSPLLPPPPPPRPPTPPAHPADARTRSSSDSATASSSSHRPAFRQHSASATPVPHSRSASPLPDGATPRPTRRGGGATALARNASANAAGLASSSSSVLGTSVAPSTSTSFLPSFHPIPPARSQSRADTLPLPPRDSSASPVPPPGGSAGAAAQKSPQKSSLKNYDSKHLARELDRLGFLPHLPTSPSLVHAHTHHLTMPHLPGPLASSTSLSLPPSAPTHPPPHSSSHPALLPHSSSSQPLPPDPWALLHVHVLPLFNGEPLRCPIEDLNVLVRQHLHAALSRSPSKVMQTMRADLDALISTGMVTLSAALAPLDGARLISRLVEKWGFFYGQILPYVEGVFLPFQTDPLLRSLRSSTTPNKPRRSGGGGGGGGSAAGPDLSSTASEDEDPTPSFALPDTPPSNRVDVRMRVLHSFRDHVLAALSPRLLAYLRSVSRDFETDENGPAQWGPRFQQMLLVLVSASPSVPGSAAHVLLRAFAPALHLHRGGFGGGTGGGGGSAGAHAVGAQQQSPTSAPGFSSAALSRPRDRRGRVGGAGGGGVGLGFLWTEDEEEDAEGEGEVEDTPSKD